MNLITKTTELAMYISLNYIKEGDVVCDATCGNGNDTVVLAKAVGEKGTVIGFDIQREAIYNTRKLIESNKLENVILINQSFENISDFCEENNLSPKVVLFNLGYLPGGDKTICSEKDATLLGIKNALKAICQGGIVTVVLYQGHEKGAIEKKAVLEMVENLPSSDYHVAFVNMLNQKKNPPEILWITKKK